MARLRAPLLVLLAALGAGAATCTPGSACSCPAPEQCTFPCTGNLKCANTEMECNGAGGCTMDCRGSKGCFGAEMGCTRGSQCRFLCHNHLSCSTGVPPGPGSLAAVARTPSMACGRDSERCAMECHGSEGCRYNKMVCSSSRECALQCRSHRSCESMSFTCEQSGPAAGGECKVLCHGAESCRSGVMVCDDVHSCFLSADMHLAFSSAELTCSANTKECRVHCHGSGTCHQNTKIKCHSQDACMLSCSNSPACENIAHTCTSSFCAAECDGHRACGDAELAWQDATKAEVLCHGGGCLGLRLACPSGGCLVRCRGGGCQDMHVTCPLGASCTIECLEGGACQRNTLVGAFSVNCAVNSACDSTMQAVHQTCVSWELTPHGMSTGVSTAACNAVCYHSGVLQTVCNPAFGSPVCKCIKYSSGTPRPVPQLPTPAPTAARCERWEVTVAGQLSGKVAKYCHDLCYTSDGTLQPFCRSNALSIQLCTCVSSTRICPSWEATSHGAVKGKDNAWCEANCERSSTAIAPECVVGGSVAAMCECKGLSLTRCSADKTCKCGSAGCAFVCSNDLQCARTSFQCGSGMCDVMCSGQQSCVRGMVTCDAKDAQCLITCSGQLSCTSPPGYPLTFPPSPAIPDGKDGKDNKDDSDDSSHSGDFPLTTSGVVCGDATQKCNIRCTERQSCEGMPVVCGSTDCHTLCDEQLACQKMSQACSGGSCTAICSKQQACTAASLDWSRAQQEASLVCSDTLSCKEVVLRCPPDVNCRVRCGGRQACDGMVVYCPSKRPAGVTCSVSCESDLACRNLVVHGDYQIHCNPSYPDACPNNVAASTPVPTAPLPPPSSLKEVMRRVLRMVLRVLFREFLSMLELFTQALLQTVPGARGVDIHWVCPAGPCSGGACKTVQDRIANGCLMPSQITSTTSRSLSVLDTSSGTEVDFDVRTNEETNVTKVLTDEVVKSQTASTPLSQFRPQGVQQSETQIYVIVQSDDNDDNVVIIVVVVVVVVVVVLCVVILALLYVFKFRKPSDDRCPDKEKEAEQKHKDVHDGSPYIDPQTGKEDKEV